MAVDKAQILARLQKEILPLQGLKTRAIHHPVDVGLGKIREAFANKQFPLSAIHEFMCKDEEQISVSAGFVAALVSSIANNNVVLWLGASRRIFPPALKAFGLQPHHSIFITVKRRKDLFAAIEEALQCKSLSAVVADSPDLNFKESRRFQLAVEESGVTGFLLRHQAKNLSTACVTRWMIESSASANAEGLPGIGYPRWKLDLLKVRNGKPSKWEVEWSDKKFSLVEESLVYKLDQHLRTG